MNLLENGNKRKPASRARGRGYDKGSRAARSAAASRGRASSGSGSPRSSGYSYRGGSHRRKKGPDYKMIAIIGVILIVLIACIAFVVKATKSGGGEETGESQTETAIEKNVSVEGVSITGMSRSQAQAELKKQFNWDMKVAYGEETYEVKDLLDARLEALLDEIYSGTGEMKESYSLDMTGMEEDVAQEAKAAAAMWDKSPKNGSIESYDKDTDKFVFSGEEAGFAIDQEKLAADIQAAMDSRDFDAVIQAEGSAVQPELTQAAAKEKYKTISTFTTTTTSNKKRNTNVRLAAEALNGTVVLPGHEFSFNKTVGQRTEEKGYQSAAAYSGGEVVQEIGGGVCQVSSTLYNAVVRAGLEISYRRSHTFEPSYVTPGQDATISWDQPDFRFINNSKAAIGIRSSYSNQKMTVSVYGIPLLEEGMKIEMESTQVETLDPPAPQYEEDQTLQPGEEKVKSAGTNGSRWETYKVITKDGKEVSRELDHRTTYKGHAPVILRNTSGVVLTPNETTTGTETAVSTVDGMPEDFIPGESTTGTVPSDDNLGPGVVTTAPAPAPEVPQTSPALPESTLSPGPGAEVSSAAPVVEPISPNPGQ